MKSIVALLLAVLLVLASVAAQSPRAPPPAVAAPSPSPSPRPSPPPVSSPSPSPAPATPRPSPPPASAPALGGACGLYLAPCCPGSQCNRGFVCTTGLSAQPVCYTPRCTTTQQCLQYAFWTECIVSQMNCNACGFIGQAQCSLQSGPIVRTQPCYQGYPVNGYCVGSAPAPPAVVSPASPPPRASPTPSPSPAKSPSPVSPPSPPPRAPTPSPPPARSL